MPLLRLGRNLFRLLVFSFSIPILFLSSIVGAHASGTIVIGEIAWAGSSQSIADEWVELWNLGDAPISLVGYKLVGAGGTQGIAFGTDDVIAPRSAFLISNYAADDTRSALSVIPDVVTTTISLANDKLQIDLLDPDGQIVDTANDGKTPLAGQSSPIKGSMIRTMPLSDGTIAPAWSGATVTDGFDAGTTDLGSPGVCDGCAFIAMTPVPSTTGTSFANDVPPPVIVPTTSSADTMTIPPLDVTTSTEDTATSTQLIVSNSDATSTTEVAPFLDSTSTPISIPMDPSTSTSEVADTAPIESATTSAPISFISTTSTDELALMTTTTETAVTQEPTSNLDAAATSDATIPAPIPIILRLNEVFPHPSSGSEWIELIASRPFSVDELIGWSLSDDKTTFFRFTAANLSHVIVTPPFIRVVLPSAHLNNDGDVVILRNVADEIVDSMSFGATDKNQSLIRWPDREGVWLKTIQPTPDQTNLLQLPPEDPPPTITPKTVPVVQSSGSGGGSPAVTISAAHATTSASDEIRSIIESSAVSAEASLIDDEVALSKSDTDVTVEDELQILADADPPTAKATSTKSKATTKKAPSMPKPKAAPKPPADPIVTLIGTVASIPKLLAKNQFVLQTPDGRGLLVRGNGRQPSPAFGSEIRVNGTLVTNDDGTELRMLTKNRWTLLNEQATDPQPRVIDLIASDQEDNWSLIEVSGTVQEVHASTVTLDTGDASLTVSIKPVIRYRTQRLLLGDVIRVRGLFNANGDTPTLIPRMNTEITLLKHAEKKVATPPADSLPPWTPFGAAGATVAVTQGVKRVQKMREKRRLAQLLQQATDDLQTSL